MGCRASRLSGRVGQARAGTPLLPGWRTCVRMGAQVCCRGGGGAPGKGGLTVCPVAVNHWFCSFALLLPAHLHRLLGGAVKAR